MSSAAAMLLSRARAAADDGDNELAHSYADAALTSDPDEDQRVEAWLRLSHVCSETKDKQKYLEYALGLQPWNPEVHRGLALLRGDLKPEEVVDPSRMQAPAARQDKAEVKRYVCQQCGGPMTFDPVDQAVVCAYCGNRQPAPVGDDPAALDERDFAVALATARGHSRPVATRSIECQGCGASFLLSPGTLSLNCPYCQSPYVLEAPATKELLPPDGVLGFTNTQEDAHDAIRGWLGEKRLQAEAQTSPPAGVYLPVWTFDIGGEIRWHGYQNTYQSNRRWQKVPVSGRHPLLCDDLLVPASHALPADLMAETERYDLSALQSYDPAYLSGWPAEIYQVAVSDASIVARQKVWVETAERVRSEGIESMGIEDLKMNSAGIAVTSFKLILLPFWVGRYAYRGETFRVVANGQTLAVRGQAPRSTLRRLFDKLMGD
ncbi:MAG: hypothetical protein ACYC5O_19315 [Anaerolineae bacterium]